MLLGKGGKTFLKKSFSLPSPNPIPPFPKTFGFIESLFTDLPVNGKRPDGRPFGRFLWELEERGSFFPLRFLIYGLLLGRVVNYIQYIVFLTIFKLQKLFLIVLNSGSVIVCDCFIWLCPRKRLMLFP